MYDIIELILVWIFIVGVFLGLLFTAFNLIGAALYELVQAMRERKQIVNQKYAPLFSIVIPVYNESAGIVPLLDSIRQNSYRKVQVIVSDDISTDNTRDIVRQYIKDYPKFSLRLVAKRKKGGRGAGIDAGLQHATGELVMAVDGDCVLEKHAIRNMVRHFADGQTAAVAANIKIMDIGNMISMLQQFDYLISFRSKKFNTIANCEYIIGGAGATYRRDLIKKLRGFDHSMQTEDIEMSLRIAKEVGNRQARLKYASDVVIYTEPVPSYKSLFKQRYRWKFGSLQAMFKHRRLFFSLNRNHSKLLTLLRLPFVLWSELMLLFEPLYFGYFLYLAIINRNATLFVSASLFMAALTLIAIWADEHMKLSERFKMSAFAPMMYLAFYTMTIIQILAALKSLINVQMITGKKHITGSYIPPERVRQGAAAKGA